MILSFSTNLMIWLISLILCTLSLSLSLSLFGYQESYSFIKKGYLGVLVFLGKGFTIAIPYLKAFM